jgi:serine/threonine protein kinase
VTEADRWREVDRLFEAALDRPPEERVPFLDAACGADAELRAEVAKLLAADEAGSGDFLEQPALALLTTTSGTEREGTPFEIEWPEGAPGPRLGPYRLIAPLQSGGMGTVYRAARDDDQYQRQVAIKMLRAGLCSDEGRHRFRVERQILARLEHPHIARLYEGGETEEGCPYLVMELIDGEPIDRYCDNRRLTIEERLGLFRQVCGAVQHAHQSLLVHRDLKPSNILVTAAGEPKLLDFGIAKELDAAAGDAGLTRTGLRLLTPGYGSPEQARGEPVSTASDVYSLGVLLYELLCGRSPYRLEGLAPHEVEREIGTREPLPPSRAVDPATPEAEAIAQARGLTPRGLRRRLAGDLDNVVAHALRKEPHRRYPSAASLSGDLKAHLFDLPVAARPDSLAYRLTKGVRRHRLGVAAAALLVALLSGFLVSLRSQQRRLATERDKAEQALSFLLKAATAANPYESGDGAPTVQDLLDKGAQEAAHGLRDQPEVQAALFESLSRVNARYFRFAEAEALLRQALALRERAFGKGSREASRTREHLREVARARTTQGLVP